jgi:hypothetical protein
MGNAPFFMHKERIFRDCDERGELHSLMAPML